MAVWTGRFFAAVVLVVLVLGGYSFCQVIIPRIVSRAVAPDGTEMCIVQRFNWSPELFTTSFVCRKPGTPWGEFYFDHQDYFWASSQVTFDPDAQVAVFFRDGIRAITFAWASETYTMHRWSRTETGPYPMHPVWAPLLP